MRGTALLLALNQKSFFRIPAVMIFISLLGLYEHTAGNIVWLPISILQPVKGIPLAVTTFSYLIVLSFPIYMTLSHMSSATQG
jgi:hypothetical protein